MVSGIQSPVSFQARIKLNAAKGINKTAAQASTAVGVGSGVIGSSIFSHATFGPVNSGIGDVVGDVAKSTMDVAKVLYPDNKFVTIADNHQMAAGLTSMASGVGSNRLGAKIGKAKCEVKDPT